MRYVGFGPKTFEVPLTVIIWKTLFLVYDRIAVAYQDQERGRVRFEYTMTAQEVREGAESFAHFPRLVDDLTSGAARIECEVLRATEPLTTLTVLRAHEFWPSPNDVRLELSQVRRIRDYHSILVYWPRHNFLEGTSVPSGGWGLGMGASAWSYDATYATVANAIPAAWKVPLIGEVWLHEWLHGVCAHFAKRGHRMPAGEADGADRHGYVRSPQTGWTDYYRDLMNAGVMEDGQPMGIPASAWSAPLR